MRYILIFLTLFYSIYSKEETVGFADYLFSRGEYNLAIHEYRHNRVFNNNLKQTQKIDYNIGKSYQITKNYLKSSNYFENIIENEKSDNDFRKSAHFELVQNCLFRKEFRLAKYELSEIKNYKDLNTNDNATIKFIDLVTDAQIYKIDSALKKIEEFPDNTIYNKKILNLKETLLSYKKEEFKKPLYAYAFSGIIPGMGQHYLGYKKEAVSAFILVSALSSVMVYSGYKFVQGDKNSRYIFGMDMFAWGMFVWRRYFGGSRKSAYELGINHNQKIQKKYQYKILRILK